MIIAMAIVVGVLYAAGLYLLMRRSIVKLIFGLVLLSHAANLLIFTASGLGSRQPPLVAAGEQTPALPVADPLPQALILTAIVISFGVMAFTVVLVHRAVEVGDTDDLEAMQVPER